MGTLIRLSGDRRAFVAGMYWRHEDRYPSKKVLKDGARNKDFIVAVRRTQAGAIQSGFTEPVLNEDGRHAGQPFKGKMYSLAAAVAEVLQEPWQGVFDLGDGRYWYVAVRENYEVLPDGDFIGDYDAVDKRMREHASYDAWRLTINGNTEKLLELVSKSVKQKPVRDIRKNTWLPVLIYSGLVGTAVIGGIIYWNYVNEQIEQAKRAALMHRLAIERAMMEQKAKANVPWLQLAGPFTFLESCLQGMSGIPLSDHGWLLSAVSCQQTPDGARLSSQHFNLTWRWSPGATTLISPPGAMSHQGSEIDQPINGLSLPASRNGVLLRTSVALRKLYGIAQITHVAIHVSLSSSVSPVSRLPGAKTPPIAATQKKLWKVFSVSMQGPLDALTIDRTWETLPGLRWTRMVYPVMASKKGKNEAQVVTMYGDLYVRNRPVEMIHRPAVALPLKPIHASDKDKVISQGAMHDQP
ncbi:type 4b pilus protein PilO2 [Acidithiobacillus albertensis]|uniref:type 4b pilus protein PilO2 n=1 Tax=Acidithiobacillus albertensis TaxID=119978 RepID=UPI001C07CEF4|nr:type 4b pilus protein PilO2 [Acidithiobacillus albertensis]MBU2742283.1 type 4b pilus protein PilO2 [Acidithiobacillus albertensis]